MIIFQPLKVVDSGSEVKLFNLALWELVSSTSKNYVMKRYYYVDSRTLTKLLSSFY